MIVVKRLKLQLWNTRERERERALSIPRLTFEWTNCEIREGKVPSRVDRDSVPLTKAGLKRRHTRITAPLFASSASFSNEPSNFQLTRSVLCSFRNTDQHRFASIILKKNRLETNNSGFYLDIGKKKKGKVGSFLFLHPRKYEFILSLYILEIQVIVIDKIYLFFFSLQFYLWQG